MSAKHLFPHEMKLRALLIIFVLLLSHDITASESITWTSKKDAGETQVHLYFFWSQKCPHCLKAVPFIDSLQQDYAWLQVHSAEISQNRLNLKRYAEMARSLGHNASSVPAFFICGQLITGYDSPRGIGQQILDLASTCRHTPVTALSAADESTLQLPFIGSVDADSNSLLMFTLIIAGMDSFNPCAFFVLMFLLSLMVHARSRARMLLIGSTFVGISALIYFLFMSAWLNLFMMIGAIPVITLIAGMVAVIIGIINTKDYFFFKQGPSLTIPESAKPTLYRRMRDLLKTDNIATMLLGTATLAVAANSYELLCTAGFPMVYTRLLTLSELSSLQHYAYLVLYNLIYVIPLIIIVIIFSYTLAAYKLSEQQGRFLKLLSGLMMLGLGLIMLFAPNVLVTTIWAGFSLLVAAVLIATAIHWLSKWA
jgi:glutaredoxin